MENQLSGLEMDHTIRFIKAYMQFEKMSFKASSEIIKKIVPAYQAQHLCSSWKGRKNDFGDFFLNMSHAMQGDFIEYFKVPVAGLREYKKAQEVVSMETIFMPGPPTVMWLRGLMMHFYNHSIDSTDKLTLPDIGFAGDRYGCSTNWGNYILLLQNENQERVLMQIYDIVFPPKAAN